MDQVQLLPNNLYTLDKKVEFPIVLRGKEKCTGHVALKFPAATLYLPYGILMQLSFGKGHST